MKNEKRIDVAYFPNWTRKAIAFTIDDGNWKLDRKFLGYVKPAGIRGTFNLISSWIDDSNRDTFLELYSDYEISNHVKYHPMAIADGHGTTVSDEPFDEATADRALLYKTDKNGLYHYAPNMNGTRWFIAADNETYIALTEACHRELEALFGVGRVKDFVWPYGKQNNEELTKAIIAMGYRSMRATFPPPPRDFLPPENRLEWGYNADCNTMTERGATFEALPDDGRIHSFIFGVHSHDFENAGKWDVLEDFCAKYGNRPSEFFYGTVGDIFDYEDAIKAAEITEHSVINHSSRPLFAVIDGERVEIAPHDKYPL